MIIYRSDSTVKEKVASERVMLSQVTHSHVLRLDWFVTLAGAATRRR
jgi:hypothetical protein